MRVNAEPTLIMKRRKFLSALALVPFVGPLLVKAAARAKPGLANICIDLKLVEENGFCLMEMWSDHPYPGAELQVLSYTEFLPSSPEDRTISGRIVVNKKVWVKHMGIWSMIPKPTNVLTIACRSSFATAWAELPVVPQHRRSQIIRRLRA